MPRKPNSHRDLAKIAASHCLKQGWCKVVAWELAFNDGIADCIGISLGSSPSARITVVEVKRTRADLLQDLKAGKMLKYQDNATHCVLAATKEALGLNKLTVKQALAELRKLGLPKTWGVWVLPTTGKRKPRSISNAKQLGKLDLTFRDKLVESVAISLCRRALNRRSPLKA